MKWLVEMSSLKKAVRNRKRKVEVQEFKVQANNDKTLAVQDSIFKCDSIYRVFQIKTPVFLGQ